MAQRENLNIVSKLNETERRLSKEVKFKNQRSDKFTIVLNDSGADLFKSARHIVHELRCDSRLCIIFVACIYHDKDLDDYENLKTPHYHLVIKFDSVYRIGTIIKLLIEIFKCNENQISIDKCNSIIMQTRYLIHLDDFDKYAYDENDVVSNDNDTFKKYLKYIKTIDTIDDLVAIVKQYKSLIELMSTIGYENYKKYRVVIADIRKSLNYA